MLELVLVNFVSSLCIFIVVFTTVFFISVVLIRYYSKFGANNFLLEFYWTLLPSILVVLLCGLNVSTVVNRYSLVGVESQNPLVVNVVGHQWYWTWEYSDSVVDSFIGQLVNSVNNPLLLVGGCVNTLFCTSSDVIHSFSLPEMGIKVDAVPGRLNMLSFVPEHLGVFVGYCSELCGTGHSYMPIVAEVVLGS